MHDPEVLVFSVRRPFPHRCGLPKCTRWHWLPLIDVWHIEPGGRDSGTVCKHIAFRGEKHDQPYKRWQWNLHVHHWKINVVPYGHVKSWLFRRCAACNRRFRWNEPHHGYTSSDETFHEACMNVRLLRSQLDDAYRYICHIADDNARFRVEYALERENVKSGSGGGAKPEGDET